MSDITVVDDDTVKVTVSGSTKEKTVSISKLVAIKADLEASLATFDDRAAVKKADVITKLDNQTATIKQGMQAKLDEATDILQQAALAGIVIE
jgi:hypothetical protein